MVRIGGECPIKLTSERVAWHVPAIATGNSIAHYPACSPLIPPFQPTALPGSLIQRHLTRDLDA